MVLDNLAFRRTYGRNYGMAVVHLHRGIYKCLWFHESDPYPVTHRPGLLYEQNASSPSSSSSIHFVYDSRPKPKRPHLARTAKFPQRHHLLTRNHPWTCPRNRMMWTQPSIIIKKVLQLRWRMILFIHGTKPCMVARRAPAWDPVPQTKGRARRQNYPSRQTRINISVETTL